MKNVGKFFALIALLAFGAVNAKADSKAVCNEVCAMDKVIEYLRNQTIELVDYEVDYQTLTLVAEDKKFSGKKYGFALVEAYEMNYGKEYRAKDKAHCAAIFEYLPNRADTNVICSKGINEEARIDFKGAYFTIVFDYFRDRNVNKTYTTYKFIDDDFYLYQYSREYFKEGDGAGQFVLDKTDIFYRQPRDDKNKSVLIPISAVNQPFRENLEKQCYKSGKCKE